MILTSKNKEKKYHHLKDSNKADSTPANTKIQPIIWNSCEPHPDMSVNLANVQKSIPKAAASMNISPPIANQLYPLSAFFLVPANCAIAGANKHAIPKPTSPSNTINSPILSSLPRK